jgi:two-component system sensor kinase FixL
VRVRDHGCGFSAEVAAAMFGPSSTGSDGLGLGLGLAISRSIIEAHDGRIWAECSPEAGRRSASACPRSAVRAAEEKHP